MSTKYKDNNEIELPLLNKDFSSIEEQEIKPKTPFYSLIPDHITKNLFQRSYSLLSIVLFRDISRFLFGYKGDLGKVQPDDLPLPYDHYDFEAKLKEFHEKWQLEDKKANPSLILLILSLYKKEFCIPGIVIFISVTLRLLIILLMGEVMDMITRKARGEEVDLYKLITYLFTFAVLELGLRWGNITTNYFIAALGNRMRNTIMAYVYTKIQSTALTSIHEMSIGKVVNLLGNNLVEIENNMFFVWWAIYAPYCIVLATYAMWQYFGFYSLISVIGQYLAMLLTNWSSKKTIGSRQGLSSITDERIRLTNEFIDSIRMIKLYAWEKPLKQAILSLRNKEILGFQRVYVIEFIGKISSEVSTHLCAFIMCASYTIMGGRLESSKLYTTIMILGFAKHFGLASFQPGSVFLANMRVLSQRIISLIRIPDIEGFEDIGLPQAKNTGEAKDIVIENLNAYWKKEAEEPFLKNINCVIPAGKVTAVIGKVGSGKTTLLQTFLKEVPKTTGSLKFKGAIAYVEQEPIVFSGTIRWNITFGEDYDEKLYQEVIRSCGLVPDLRNFPNGDMTIVGEKGINLSGGQKARLSLARAIYSRSDIYLLDDPLSAVDAKVALQLFNDAIRGRLLREKTVILVTHHLSYAKEADNILVLDNGELIAQGPFEKVEKEDINLLNIFNKENKSEEEEIDESHQVHKKSKKMSVYDNTKHKEQEKSKEISSDVTFETYKNYLKTNGQTRKFCLLIILYCVDQCNLFIFVRFLGYWAAEQTSFYAQAPEMIADQEFENNKYVFWGFSIFAALALGKFCKIYLTMKFLLETNTKIHNMMLQKISRATIAFFDNTPVGVILNRFSGDLSNSDKENYKIFLEVFEGFVYLILFMIVFSIVNPIIIPTCLFSIYFVSKSRAFFVKPLGQSRRLDMEAKSPLYSDISMTLHGLCIVRSFRQGKNFIKNFFNLMAKNSRVFQFQIRSFRFFIISVDISVYILIMGGMFGYLYAAYNLQMKAETFGSAITLILDVVQMAGMMLRSSVNMDVAMQNAQRMLDFTNLPQEAPEEIPNKDELVKKEVENKWPDRGEIIFRNIFMKYGPDLPYAVNGIDFKIRAGTTVGCIGRTGAGKSSIIQALFRMVESEKIPGSYIKIDGIKTDEIGLDLLRSNLSIIPQMPVIFTGSIRRNLDPFNLHTDEELQSVMREVNLHEYVNSLPNGIMTEINLGNSIFSAGQKQQVCLARAILRKSKIIVLDEATANVDIETDLYIQEKVLELFKGSTILTIAHRLVSIANYDKILVLDKGRVLEYNDPFLLLVNDVNDTRITGETLFAEMVMSSGANLSRKIFEIARQSFFTKYKL